MKRCPVCYEVYEGGERFCEADGEELLAEPTLPPQTRDVSVTPPARSAWWPAAAVGVSIGVVVGAGVFAGVFMMSAPESEEHHTTAQSADVRQTSVPTHAVTASTAVQKPEAEESPSPEAEEAETEPSPAPTAETKIASTQLNQGPISTGEKIRSNDGENLQTVIEMNDGSSLDVEAAWEDKQGIWYRRSGLVSFVESSRVKAITARRASKVADVPNR
jgi:hypothetical protein